MSADVMPIATGLPERLERDLAAALTATMRRVAGEHGLPALLWRVDDLRALGRPWPLLPRLAIQGAPKVDVDDPDPVGAAQRWAQALCLVEHPARVRGVVEWRGDVAGMAVRVWSFTDGAEVGS